MLDKAKIPRSPGEVFELGLLEFCRPCVPMFLFGIGINAGDCRDPAGVRDSFSPASCCASSWLWALEEGHIHVEKARLLIVEGNQSLSRSALLKLRAPHFYCAVSL